MSESRTRDTKKAKDAYSADVIQGVQLRRQPTVYAQELFVHDSGERERAERVHACFVDPVGVLVLAFQLEREVVRKMPAFVVSSEQEERIGVPDLQRPQIQDALYRIKLE